MAGDPQSIPFDAAFRCLNSDRQPFPWQRRLHDEWFAKGKVPAACTLPTGLGKTAVMSIWLIALARKATLPRRLFYIVNRRTVVDQATEHAERMLKLIVQPATAGQHEGTICRLRDALSQIAGDNTVIPCAVSTLRGELADNGEWKADPACPAIIVGTIDMIGSKLLFSGYGDGRYGRAHHAGLIGQDALIVHDESHLTPAFSRLLRDVEQEQNREFNRDVRAGTVTRPIRIMDLSATIRSDGGSGALKAPEVLGIEDADTEDSVVRQRLTARKRLSFVEVDAEANALAGAMAGAALQHDDKRCRVLVYVRSPEAAATVRQAIIDGIEKGKRAHSRLSMDDAQKRVGLLTGTFRGLERDQLTRSDLFRAFKSDPNRPAHLEQTLYLVSTSAGEVGVDLDADQLVCDLTTLDNMAQRFGRVNRLGGERRAAEIAVVEKAGRGAEPEFAKKSKPPGPLDMAIAKTGEILRRIAKDGGDVSPAALSKLLKSTDGQAAFSPTPTILAATDILFDTWGLTSISGELPGRPEVGPYLHGVAAWEPPETYVAWRAELTELAEAGVSADDMEEVFDAFPIWSPERLRDRTDRVFDELRKVAKRLDGDHDPRAVLIKQNNVQWVRLSELAPEEKERKNAAISRLAYAVVVLPVEIGGLKDGMLSGTAAPPKDPTALDVAEAKATGRPVRQRVWINTGGTETALLNDSNGALPCKLRITLADDEAEDMVKEGPHKVAMEYRVEKAESGEPGTAVTLRDHTAAVELAARRIGDALGLPSSLCEALGLAARWHDRGKDRTVWQRFARNDAGREPLAKSARYLHGRALSGYRHEFGSLIEAMADKGIGRHSERDLILHVIAAHHGWARPHFEPRAFDYEGPRGGADGERRAPTSAGNEAALIEAMQRFGRLQQRFGRWGLAWLESILRCADVDASARGTSVPPVSSNRVDAACMSGTGVAAPTGGGAA